MRKAVYAGSFDPITLGHQWIIQQAAPLFDQLVVAIGLKPEKRATFTVDERLDLSLRPPPASPPARRRLRNKYLVDYADQVGAGYIIRGIRNRSISLTSAMRHINSDLHIPEVLTLFLMPPRHLAELSSNMVKGMSGAKKGGNPLSSVPLLHRFQALKADHERVNSELVHFVARAIGVSSFFAEK